MNIQKIKNYLSTHEKEYEILRYLIAGGLTTLLSFVVFSLYCILVSPDRTIDGASEAQALTGNIISWVIAVLFAFWINRRMVFRRQNSAPSAILKELGQFLLSRMVSGIVFEVGLFWLMASLLGISNTVTKIVSLVLVTVFNYVVSKFWIFRQKPEESKE